MDTYKLSVRLPIDLADLLKTLASADNRTVQATVEKAIRNYLAVRKATGDAA